MTTGVPATCTSCTYTTQRSNVPGLKLHHIDGDVSNDTHTNLRFHCPPCEAILRCGSTMAEGLVQLASSDMDQVEIIRRTRQIFEQSGGTVPSIREVDPLAVCLEIGSVDSDLANRLKLMGMPADREELKEEEKGLRAFFTQSAGGLFTNAVAIKQSDLPNATPSNTQALKRPTSENTLLIIRFSHKSKSTLDRFFTTWPPSSTLQSRVAWICVDNAHLQPADSTKRPVDMAGLEGAWNNICSSGRQPAIADLDELAQRFDQLGGKWLVFATHARVDSLWAQIARATYAGKLGPSSKVSPRDDSQDSHVICVFTQDYTDEIDVGRVRKALRRLGVYGRIGYKPDVYTYCGVYRGNSWQISPTRYYY